MNFSLAPVQRQTLEYLRNFIADKGFAPTLKDLAEFLGVRSASTAHFHLSRLEQKGFIKKGANGSIELLENTASSDPMITGSPYTVPLLGLIAAGAPIEAIEDSTVMVEIPSQYFSKKRELFCLQVTSSGQLSPEVRTNQRRILSGRPRN